MLIPNCPPVYNLCVLIVVQAPLRLLIWLLRGEQLRPEGRYADRPGHPSQSSGRLLGAGGSRRAAQATADLHALR